jgi:hypothetical protein
MPADEVVDDDADVASSAGSASVPSALVVRLSRSEP